MSIYFLLKGLIFVVFYWILCNVWIVWRHPEIYGQAPPDDLTYIITFLIMPIIIPISEIQMAWYKFGIKFLGRDPHIKLSDCKPVEW
ncbi:MAG: hypothetical protein HY226_05925 [Candidatus Vogelbacteria bacterium]|nr:hypothetical protein [Candidatus Vogelbacteria bacterium]